MKKISLIISIILLLIISIISAHEHNAEETKQIIDSGISCDKLSDEQLEMIGEYYMEQMHPGEQHEMMDEMMGGEGSESLKQMHINMAKSLYCGQGSMMGSGGMMGMMPMMMGNKNMMNSGGMMNMMGNNMMGSGMMGNMGFGYWNFFSILYLVLLIGLVILVYLWIIKLWRNMNSKKRKR